MELLSSYPLKSATVIARIRERRLWYLELLALCNQAASCYAVSDDVRM